MFMWLQVLRDEYCNELSDSDLHTVYLHYLDDDVEYATTDLIKLMNMYSDLVYGS